MENTVDAEIAGPVRISSPVTFTPIPYFIFLAVSTKPILSNYVKQKVAPYISTRYLGRV